MLIINEIFDNQNIKDVFAFFKQKRIIRNQQDFTERIGYDKSTVSQIMNDRVAVPNRMIENICIAFPMINERWLLTGEGSMLNPPTSNSQRALRHRFSQQHSRAKPYHWRLDRASAKQSS